MFWVLVVMAVAAVFGFALSVVFFLSQSGLKAKWRWLGAIVGGLIVAVLMAMVTFTVVWPPFDLLTSVAGIIIAVLVTTVALVGTKGGAQKGEGGVGHADVGNYDHDFGSGTGS